MSKEEVTIARAVELAGEKLAEMNKETSVYLREILKGEAKRLYNDAQVTDSAIIAEKLNDLVKRMNQVFQKKTQPLEPPLTDWFYINSYTTYYQDSDPQKIVVNVINDDAAAQISPSKRDRIQKFPEKRTYRSSNTIIGSRTIEDLFQVIQNQRSTSPINERVIIIDNYDANSSKTSTTSSIPPAGYPPQQPAYSNTQFIYTSASPSYIYVTTTSSNFYPFTFFQYWSGGNDQILTFRCRSLVDPFSLFFGVYFIHTRSKLYTVEKRFFSSASSEILFFLFSLSP